MFRELDLMLGDPGGRMQLWGRRSNGRPVPDMGDSTGSAAPGPLRVNQTGGEKAKGN